MQIKAIDRSSSRPLLVDAGGPLGNAWPTTHPLGTPALPARQASRTLVAAPVLANPLAGLPLPVAAPSPRFQHAELDETLDWVVASYTPQLTPARIADIATSSLRSLASVAPQASVQERDGSLELRRGDTLLARVAMPRDGTTWSAAAVAFHAALPEVPREAGYEAFFRGLRAPLDRFSWYKTKSEAASFNARLNGSQPRDEVSARIVDGVGVIRIKAFTSLSPIAVREALSSWGLLEGGTPVVRGVVVDVTDNPGGVSQAASAIADRFIREGRIYSEAGTNPASKEEHDAVPVGDISDVPVIVLQNGASASAAELFAMAMQENRRGVVRGTSSFGKGKVQETRPTPDGGLLAITVAYFAGPSGITNDGQGVTPNDCIGGSPLSASERDRLRLSSQHDESETADIRVACPAVPRHADAFSPRAAPLSDDTREQWIRESVAIVADHQRYDALLHRVTPAPIPIARSAGGLPWWSGAK